MRIIFPSRALIAAWVIALTIPARAAVFDATCACGHQASQVGDCRTHMCSGAHGDSYAAMCGGKASPAAPSPPRKMPTPSATPTDTGKERERARFRLEREREIQQRRRGDERKRVRAAKEELRGQLKLTSPAPASAGESPRLELKPAETALSQDCGRVEAEAGRILEDYRREGHERGLSFLAEDVKAAVQGENESGLERMKTAIERIERFKRDFVILAECLDKKCELKALEERISEEVRAWLEDQLPSGMQNAFGRVKEAKSFLSSYLKRLAAADYRVARRASACLGTADGAR